MVRRRPFRRRPGPLPRGGPQQALLRANHLKDNGNYREAAQIFERLARGAHNRGILKHAPFLYLQAAHCCLLSSQAERGIALMNQGLGLLEGTHRWPALNLAGERSVSELRQARHDQAADNLQVWLEGVLIEHPEAAQVPASTPVPAGQPAPSLPSKCPFGGASLRSDQVEWIDGNTAKCLYCGSAVSTEL